MLLSGQVKIYDITGKLILEKNFENQNLVTLNTTFNKGLYLVEVKSKLFSNTKKLIIN